MAKPTLVHYTTSNVRDTRTTARAYSHVVEARVCLAGLNEVEAARELKVYGAGEDGFTAWRVISWSGSYDLACKAAGTSMRRWSHWECKAVAIKSEAQPEAVAAVVSEPAVQAAPVAEVENLEIESGLTGPDWEPTAGTKYYAQCGKRFEFGATEAEAIAKIAPQITEARATGLAVRIVGYCHANGLALDGLVAELGADMPLDADRAKRLTTYCDQVQCLTLGGLVDEVWELRNEYAEAGNTSVRKATMRHTATLEVELAYNRAKSLAGVNLANAVDELASAWNEMSGEALRDELRKLVNVHKVHVNGAHTARVNAGVNGVDRKVFADEI